MAVRNRSSSTTYVDEINSDGVATQLELETEFANHLLTHHDSIDGLDYYVNANGDTVSKQLFVKEFFDHDNITKNIYLFNQRDIRCTDGIFTIPFGQNFIIDKIQVTVDDDIPKIGNTFTIEDHSFTPLYEVNTLGLKSELFEDLNIIVPQGTGILVYVKEQTIRKPIVTMWFRLIQQTT